MKINQIQDLDLDHVPNTRPKWDQKLIEAIGNNVCDPSKRKRTRSQFYIENNAMCHTNPLSLEMCYVLPKRCYTMVGFDPKFYKYIFHDLKWKAEMNKVYESLQYNETLDLISLPRERKDKSINNSFPIWHPN